MEKNPVIQVYKKDSLYSYAAGAYAVYELLSARPEMVETVYIHSGFTDAGHLESLCRDKKIPVTWGNKAFKRINSKENTYAAASFRKYYGTLSSNEPQIVLVNPSDMGNLGSSIRTMVGLNIMNLAVILPTADIWHPKTIRASMGAIYRIEFELFPSFTEYRKRFPKHDLFPFFLDGQIRLSVNNCPRSERYALIFGNEGTGLPSELKNAGTTIQLAQTANVDSMNLSVAIGIGAFIFSCSNGRL